MDNAGALPTTPQAPQPPQKRSIDVLPKPDNLTCYLQWREGERGEVANKAIERQRRGWAWPPKSRSLMSGPAPPSRTSRCTRRHHVDPPKPSDVLDPPS